MKQEQDHDLPPRLMNLREAARFIGVKPHTIRWWVTTRRIPALRIGARLFFDPRQVEAWINGSQIVPTCEDKPRESETRASDQRDESSLTSKSRNRRRAPDFIGVEEVEAFDEETTLEP